MIQTGTSGDWSVRRIWSDAYDGELPAGLRYQAGWYTWLFCGDQDWMSDMPVEWNAHQVAINECQRRGGRVLINGLGLGLIASAVVDAVNSVTVVERSPDVIKLVAPHIDARIKVVQADAFTYDAPGPFEVVWHDIWASWSGNEEEIDTLHAKYRNKCQWQGDWPTHYQRIASC